jgi:hypothetical protein
MAEKTELHTCSYLQTEHGAIPLAELSDRQRQALATALKLRYCSTLFSGRAVFWQVEEKT